MPSQQRLIKAVHEVNKNIILVLINGSPVSLKWEKDNIPAIIEAWYPGQEGGNAIADIIFGDYSPNGKLPITFYEDDDQLIDFYDYDITKGRTYMYLEDQPLYPFGFGLSYTTFELNNFKMNGDKFQIKDTIRVTFDIINSGDMDGAEVVQLYVRPDVLSKYVPNKQLKSFEKVFLKHGETRRVQLTIPVHRLASFNSVLRERCSRKM